MISFLIFKILEISFGKNIKGEEIAKPGYPNLPVVIKMIKLGEEELTEINLIEIKADTEKIKGEIPPVTPQVILKLKPKKVKKSKIYEKDTLYPGKIYEYEKAKIKNVNYLLLKLYPVQYNPRKSTLIKISDLKFEILTKKSKNKTLNSIDYLIITSDSLSFAFLPLLKWREEEGFRCALCTVEWIEENYHGRDLQEKIRNYLKAVKDSGVKYVLLGGAHPIIPVRYAYAFDCQAGIMPNENDIPCDLYYADLDGDWDRDGDGVFGEVEDSVDLYPDLSIGRAPVRNYSEAVTFVNKILKYEKYPHKSSKNKALMLGEILWYEPYTDAGIGKDMICEILPPYFEIDKLYQSYGNEDSAHFFSSINSGKNFVNHDGHGWWYIMCIGEDYLFNGDTLSFTNSDMPVVWVSIGCWVGALDYVSIAECYTKTSKGGAVAFIANSRYGWGSPGNPGYGYSDKFDKRIFYEIFKDSVERIGDVLSFAKSYYVPLSHDSNVYRWHQFQINLFGDPAMKVWTEKPKRMQIITQDTIPQGNITLNIAVIDSENRPLNNVRICILKDTEIYIVDTLSGSGVFSFTTYSPGTLIVTCLKRNYIPCQKKIYIKQVNFVSLNYVIEEGDTFKIRFNLSNEGDTSRNVKCHFYADSIILLDTLREIGILPSGQSKTDSIRFLLSQIQNGKIYLIKMMLTSDKLNQEFVLKYVGKKPILHFVDYLNERITPDYSGSLYVVISNKGLDTLFDTLEISVSDANVSPHDLIVKLLPYQICTLSVWVNKTGSPPWRLHSFVRCEIDTITFYIFVGDRIKVYDFEDTVEWKVYGKNCLWHRTNLSSHSGSYSYYCGDEVTQEYRDNMDASLVSPSFIVTKDSKIGFWYKFDVPIYGCDGMYVELVKDDSLPFATLDYTGTGGALDSLTMGHDWCYAEYDISEFEGETLQLRFRFVADGDSEVSTGFFVDDVKLMYLIGDTIKEKEQVEKLRRIHIYPNPSRSILNFYFETPESQNVKVEIYDVAGRLQKAFYMKLKEGKNHFREKAQLKSGVYFVRIKSFDYCDKIIIVR